MVSHVLQLLSPPLLFPQTKHLPMCLLLTNEGAYGIGGPSNYFIYIFYIIQNMCIRIVNFSFYVTTCIIMVNMLPI